MLKNNRYFVGGLSHFGENAYSSSRFLYEKLLFYFPIKCANGTFLYAGSAVGT